jgi:Trp operon repressor
MPGSELVEKIEILIETLKNNNNQSQVIDNSTVAGVNTITGGSTTTNIFQNSSERDIPYIERNKYRHKLIYSRGLI